MNEYRTAIEKLIKSTVANPLLTCTVAAVDEAKRTCTCDPVDGSAQLLHVKLAALFDGGIGTWAVPAQGSEVIVGRVDGSRAFAVVQYSAVEKVIIGGGDSNIAAEVSDGGIVLNGGQFGGLVKIEALVQKLNAVENVLNALITAFNSHTHISPPAPTNPVTTAPPAPPFAQSVTISQATDLENTKITHG